MKDLIMLYSIPTLDLEIEKPGAAESEPPTWLVERTMESGRWVLGGECSASDRTKLLLDMAAAFSNGTPLFGGIAEPQNVAYINYSKSAEASAEHLQQVGLKAGDLLSIHHPRYIGPNSLHSLIREAMPNGGLVLIDGITGSIFGGRKETLDWLEVVMASAAPKSSLIVALPEGISSSRTLRNREERLLRYANLLWLKSEKGQLNLELRPHNSDDSNFYFGESGWQRSHGRNPLNPTEAAIVDTLRNTNGALTNLEIQNRVEAGMATKVSDRFHKIIQRVRADEAICRHPKIDGLYYHPDAWSPDIESGSSPTSGAPSSEANDGRNETQIVALSAAIKSTA